MSAPDYKDDLYFEPKLTWKEFIEWCKFNHGNYCHVVEDNVILNIEYGQISCDKNGNIFFSNDYLELYPVVFNRSYEQLKEIIKNIFD